MGKRTKFWSDQEIDLLKNNFLIKTNEELSVLCDCTVKQIISQLKKLNLSKRQPEPNIGDKLFRLTIQDKFMKLGKTHAKCLCDCGKITEQRLTSMVQGHIKSCGCWKAEQASERLSKQNYKHGEANFDNRIYRIWSAMKTRCNNPNIKEYHIYGGRGIKICSEWEDYTVFKQWSLNNGYGDKLSIDRIDNDKGYSPDNCRWVTMAEQCRNRRNNRLDTVKVTAYNETKTLQDWLDDSRCSVRSGTTICYRIGSGWKPEDAISKPSERS